MYGNRTPGSIEVFTRRSFNLIGFFGCTWTELNLKRPHWASETDWITAISCGYKEPGSRNVMSSRPPRAGNALSLGLFLFPALHPSRIFLAFILILGNMNEGNQAGMQWSQTHTDRIPIKRGLEIIIDLLPTPSSSFLFLLCPLLPFLNRSAAHWSCAFNARAHTLEGSVPMLCPWKPHSLRCQSNA